MDPRPQAGAPRLAVAIPTVGRPAILAETLCELDGQLRLPDEVLICPTSPADLPCALTSRAPLRIIALPEGTTPGASLQRNVMLDATTSDIIVFLDDDFFPARAYLAAVEAAFTGNPGLVAATGTVLADGATGPGLTAAAARARLALDQAANAPAGGDAPVAGTYGCNMAFRVTTVRQHGLRFDENLPLYSWQEDNDFSRRLSRHGRILRLAGARGVHLGHKGGKTSGVRFGYSQVANFAYLVRKGSVPAGVAVRHILRNLAANIAHAPSPEPWVDRRGRLRGNLLALADLLHGRCDPRRILSL
ncbi:MAG: glycosyltransferase [Rhodospirillales bacterium]|nr:glycosyltransferase [Rhodospirillales bacterium]